MTRRNLLKAASAFVVTGLTTALAEQTVKAHKKEALREVHLFMGDGYYRWEFKDGDRTVRTEKNAPMRVKVGQVLLFVAHNEGRLVHNAHIGRRANLTEQRYDEHLFENFFSLTLEPRSVVELELLVPDKPGEWELGDFSLDRNQKTLYEATGMKAPLIVER